MASQSSGKPTFAAMAARQGDSTCPRTETGYDRRRAVRIKPTGGATELEKETCKNFMSAFKEITEPNSITSIRMVSNTEFQAVLTTPAQVDELCKKSPIKIAEQELDIVPFVPRSRKIWIYNPSILIGNHMIKKELERHCQVAHIEDTPNEYGIPTGKSFAYVKGEQIPAAIFIGASRINITYRGMERKCRLCQSAEHAAGKCPERSCFNCGMKGHVSAECKEGCKKCGATTHTSRTCREDLPDLDSKSHFPELAINRQKNNTKALEHGDANKTSPQVTETQERDATKEKTTIRDTHSIPPDVGMVEDPELAMMNEEGAEELNIEEILQEVAAALPVCVEQMEDDEASTKTDSETQSSVSDGKLDNELASKRKRKSKKGGTSRTSKTTATNKKTKADNTTTTNIKEIAISDPSEMTEPNQEN